MRKCVHKVHDTEKFQYRKDKLIDITNELNKKWGENTVELHIKDQYYNMKNIIEEHMHLIDNAKLACERTGLAPHFLFNSFVISMSLSFLY